MPIASGYLHDLKLFPSHSSSLTKCPPAPVLGILHPFCLEMKAVNSVFRAPHSDLTAPLLTRITTTLSLILSPSPLKASTLGPSALQPAAGGGRWKSLRAEGRANSLLAWRGGRRAACRLCCAGPTAEAVNSERSWQPNPFVSAPCCCGAGGERVMGTETPRNYFIIFLAGERGEPCSCKRVRAEGPSLHGEATTGVGAAARWH